MRRSECYTLAILPRTPSRNLVKTSVARYGLATWRDLKLFNRIALGYVVTTLWPRKWDPWLVARHADLVLFSRRREVQRLAKLMESALGAAASGRDLLEAAREHYRMRVEALWGRIRQLHKHGWELRLHVDGIEHVQRGLAAGRGVILWGMVLCDSTIPKAALHRAGIRLAHLTNEDHLAGGTTLIGLKVNAPLLRRSETRHLERRVVIPLDRSLGYMRDLMDLLAANGCLSITGELEARQNFQAEMFFGPESFAPGAPGLAWKMGSALLTYHVVREGGSQYRLVIEPMELDRGVTRHEFEQTAVREFARRLRAHVEQHPSDWTRWEDLLRKRGRTGTTDEPG